MFASILFLLLACSSGSVLAHTGPGFCKEYPQSWNRLLQSYGNGTWLLVNEYHGGSPEGGRTRQRIRILTRWPDVRVDFLGNSDTVEAARVFSQEVTFRVVGLKGSGRYILESWQRGTLPGRDRFWETAVNRGWLPFVPLGWFEEPLSDHLCHCPELRIVREEWVSFG